MTSVEDVFDQLVAANGHLAELHNDALAGIAATKEVRDSVQQVDRTLVRGFTVVAEGISSLAQLSAQQIIVLNHISRQMDTALCSLDQIARNTCNIVNEAHEQTLLGREVSDAALALVEMYRTDHPNAALILARAKDARAQLERCCPPEVGPPPCTYEPCEKPQSIELPTPHPETPLFAEKPPPIH
jgi:hypothetical protein